MNNQKTAISPWFDERIEAYIDGDLEPREMRMFEAQLAVDPALEREIDAARAISDALGTVPRYRCPVDMSARLERMVSPPRRRSRFLGAALAASLAGIAALGLWTQQQTPAQANQPTKEELAAAMQDLELALAYLDKAGQQVGRQVGESVVRGALVAPMRETDRSGEGSGAS